VKWTGDSGEDGHRHHRSRGVAAVGQGLLALVACPVFGRHGHGGREGAARIEGVHVALARLADPIQAVALTRCYRVRKG
jgi:hypothetical protein